MTEKRTPADDLGMLDFDLPGDASDLLAMAERRTKERRLTKRERNFLERTKRIQEREQRKAAARQEFRVTYDLPLWLQARIEDLARDLGTSRSQVAKALLAHGLQAVANETVDLNRLCVASQSRRYAVVLDVPEPK